MGASFQDKNASYFSIKKGISFARPDTATFSLTDDCDPYKLFVIGNTFINRSWDISADAQEWEAFQERQQMILQENTSECFDP